jgi:hypothetical protein
MGNRNSSNKPVEVRRLSTAMKLRRRDPNALGGRKQLLHQSNIDVYEKSVVVAHRFSSCCHSMRQERAVSNKLRLLAARGRRGTERTAKYSLTEN